MKEKIIRQGWTNLKLDLTPGCLLCSDDKHNRCRIECECLCSVALNFVGIKSNAPKTEYQCCRKVQVIARECK